MHTNNAKLHCIGLKFWDIMEIIYKKCKFYLFYESEKNVHVFCRTALNNCNYLLVLIILLYTYKLMTLH